LLSLYRKPPLRQVDFPDPPEAYWRDIDSRLDGRIEEDVKLRIKKARRLWAVAAAAVVVLSLWISNEIDLVPPSTRSETGERILPPEEQDPEYQHLLSI
jgi:hypothetical protein